MPRQARVIVPGFPLFLKPDEQPAILNLDIIHTRCKGLPESRVGAELVNQVHILEVTQPGIRNGYAHEADAP